MEKTFKVANTGRVNQFYAQDEASVTVQEDKTLKHEIAQLVEQRKVIEKDLVRFPKQQPSP